MGYYCCLCPLAQKVHWVSIEPVKIAAVRSGGHVMHSLPGAPSTLVRAPLVVFFLFACTQGVIQITVLNG